MLRRILLLVGAVLLLTSCGDDAADTTAALVTTTTVPPTTTTVATTTTTTTSTTTTSTTTTAPPSPDELRQDFLAGLDAAGWLTYTDTELGWSIRYPADWSILDAVPGDSLTLVSGDPTGSSDVGMLHLGIAGDAGPDVEGSADYLRGNVHYAIDGGLLQEPAEDAWFYLDLDFDGESGALDIEGVEAYMVVDPQTGEPLPEGSSAPTWWYGYYDPDLRPALGYIWITLGTAPSLFTDVDDVLLSFEPPS